MKTLILSIIFLVVSIKLLGQTHQSLHDQNPPPDFENVHVEPLAGDSLSSSFLIWVKNSVALHLHEHHSEHVIILEGEGEMRIGDDTLFIQPGDYLFLPKGTPHAVWVTSPQAIKAISIQTPLFDGSDRVLLE